MFDLDLGLISTKILCNRAWGVTFLAIINLRLLLSVVNPDILYIYIYIYSI